MYEYFFPLFLHPLMGWSSFEFSGIPAFADPGEGFAYPAFVLFAYVFHSWVGFIIAAHVIAACGTYAYVYVVTRSHAPAFVSGLAFSLSEALIEHLAHTTSLHAI